MGGGDSRQLVTQTFGAEAARSVAACWVVGVPVQALPVSNALVPALCATPQAGKVLTVADRDRPRRELEKKYTGCLVELETLPPMSFLNMVKNQHDNKAGDWVPWNKVLSEKVASAVKERKPLAQSLEGLMLANCQEDILDRDISNAPYPIMQLLQVRAHAYAMVGSGHPGSWALYNSRFMKFYTNEPGPHFRFCTAQEAEEADQCAMREVFGLCYAGANLDDALSTVAIDRDMLRSLLMPRLKLEKPLDREPLKRKRPFETQKPGGGTDKRKPTGECFKWIAGECKLRQCKFKHKCAACGSTDHLTQQCAPRRKSSD